jgi:hypothetical protein
MENINNVLAQASGAGGGPAWQTNGAPVNIEDVDAAVRRQLQHGVDFGQRRLAAIFEPDITWIKVDEAGHVVAIYVKGQMGVTVHAQLRDGGVEVAAVSLDCLCCRSDRAGGP